MIPGNPKIQKKIGFLGFWAWGLYAPRLEEPATHRLDVERM